MADRRNTPWDSVADRVAEVIKQQLNKPSQPDPEREKLNAGLEQLVIQQLKTNEQLEKLTAATENQTREFQDWRSTTTRKFSQTFLRKMALEVPPVVLAVLLAFGINSWWQQRKANQTKASAFENIQQEIRSNLEILESNMEKNRRSRQEINQQIDSLKQYGYEPGKNYGRGIAIAPLQDAAWEAANISGAVASFDSEIILDLAEVYAYVETQSELNMYALDKIDVQGKLQPETLLITLETHINLLTSHIGGSEVAARRHRLYLEKYGEEDLPQ